MLRTLCLLGAGTLLALDGLGAQSARAATNLVTHNEVRVTRPAAVIWPLILDPKAWKQGNTLTHVSGPVGGVGEVFGAMPASGGTQPDYFVQNVELDPNRRRTIKLFTAGGALIGFAAFILEESNGETRVSYDVYAESLIPPDQAKGMTAEAMRRMEREGREESVRRFDSELATLKRLAEARQ